MIHMPDVIVLSNEISIDMETYEDRNNVCNPLEPREVLEYLYSHREPEREKAIELGILDLGTNNYRHCFFSGNFRRSFSSMPSYNLIPSFWPWPHKSRHKHAVVPDALRRFLHVFIVNDMKRMIFEGMKLLQRDFNNYTQRKSAWVGFDGENIIVGSQTYVFAAAFHR